MRWPVIGIDLRVQLGDPETYFSILVLPLLLVGLLMWIALLGVGFTGLPGLEPDPSRIAVIDPRGLLEPRDGFVLVDDLDQGRQQVAAGHVETVVEVMPWGDDRPPDVLVQRGVVWATLTSPEDLVHRQVFVAYLRTLDTSVAEALTRRAPTGLLPPEGPDIDLAFAAGALSQFSGWMALILGLGLVSRDVQSGLVGVHSVALSGPSVVVVRGTVAVVVCTIGTVIYALLLLGLLAILGSLGGLGVRDGLLCLAFSLLGAAQTAIVAMGLGSLHRIGPGPVAYASLAVLGAMFTPLAALGSAIWQDPDGTEAIVWSLVPFVSPPLLALRAAAGGVGWVDGLLAVGASAVVMVGFAALAGTLYRAAARVPKGISARDFIFSVVRG